MLQLLLQGSLYRIILSWWSTWHFFLLSPVTWVMTYTPGCPMSSLHREAVNLLLVVWEYSGYSLDLVLRFPGSILGWDLSPHTFVFIMMYRSCFVSYSSHILLDIFVLAQSFPCFSSSTYNFPLLTPFSFSLFLVFSLSFMFRWIWRAWVNEEITKQLSANSYMRCWMDLYCTT